MCVVSEITHNALRTTNISRESEDAIDVDDRDQVKFARFIRMNIYIYIEWYTLFQSRPCVIVCVVCGEQLVLVKDLM